MDNKSHTTTNNNINYINHPITTSRIPFLLLFLLFYHFFVIQGRIDNSRLPSTPVLSYLVPPDDTSPFGPVAHAVRPLNPDATFAGVIQIGALMSYGNCTENGTTNSYRLTAAGSVLGWKMWEYIVNYVRVPPGLTINNTQWAVNLTVINIGFYQNDVTRIANKTIIQEEFGHFDIYFGPWSTATTEWCTLYTETVKVPMIAPWSTLQTAFKLSNGARKYKYMWGILSTVDTYWDSAINSLKLKGAQTIGFWTLNDPFARTVIGGAETSSLRSAMSILTKPISIYTNISSNPFIIPHSNFVTSMNDIMRVFELIQQLDPDIVICGNRIWTTCPQIIQAMKTLHYSPRAIGFGQCLASPDVLSMVGEDLRYFLDYSIWDPKLKGAGYTDPDYRDFPPSNTSSSSARFVEVFYALFGTSPSWYSSNTYNNGYAFELVLEKAQSLDPAVMNSVFPLILETNFFGILGYDVWGWNDKIVSLVVQRNENLTLNIIFPTGTATGDIVYPFVSWDSRNFVSFFLKDGSEQAMFALYLICLLYTAVFFAFLVLHWTARSIVASSPAFLTIMLIGSCFLYSTVPVWMLYADIPSCHLRVWFLNFGFTLLFGTLTAKTHRIKELFLLKKMRPKKFSDKKLFIVVAALLSVDLILCILWSAITRPTVEKIIRKGQAVTNGQLWENLNYLECNWGSDNVLKIFYALEGSFKVAMIIYGLYLSLLLWKYGSSMWVESKAIIFAMYNLIIFALIGLALQLGLGDSPDIPTRTVLFVTRSLCFFLSGTITIGAMLIPRMLDPEGKEHEGKDATGTKRTMDTAVLQLNDLEWKYEQLEKKYKELKQRYRELDKDAQLSEG